MKKFTLQCLLFTFLMLSACVAGTSTFLATNDLAGTLTVTFCATNSAGQFTFYSLTNLPTGTSNTLTTASNVVGVAVVNQVMGVARVDTFGSLANTNGANCSYLVTNGVSTYYILAGSGSVGGISAGSGYTGTPGTIPSGNGNTNAPTSQIGAQTFFVQTDTNGRVIFPSNFQGSTNNTGLTTQQAATLAIAETNSYGTISFLRFCGTNTPMPTLKASDGYNAHGWYDQSTNLRAAIAYVSTNSVNIRNLYLPQGIYRIVATNLLIPSNVVLRGDGVFHWGIYNYSDGLQLAYTMLWFDGTNSTGVEFNNDGGDSWNGIYNIQIQGGLNPIATMDTLYRTSFTNFGLIGLQVYNTNWTWAGVFEAKHVAVNGFRVGINNDAGQAQFNFCQYAMNGVGFAEVGNPGDYYYLTNTAYCMAHPDYGTLYTNYLSVIQPHGPYGFGFADDAQNINCGGGIRIDGVAYYLTSARARHIQSDTTYMAYRIAFLSDGYYSFDDCYWEEYGNYNPLTTNAVVLLGNPNVTIRNTDFVPPTVNDSGVSNTNTCFVDLSQAGIATLTLDDCGNKAPQFLAKVNPLLQQPVNLKGSTAGLLWFQDTTTPARSHADLVTAESAYNGHFWQINDEEQYPPPSVTTNLSANNYYEPYGRIIMQRSTPDYFSAVVRTNSIGAGVGSESTQLPYSAGSYYWIRFLQSDQSPPIQVANNIWEIPANYTVAQLTVKSNLFGNIAGATNLPLTGLQAGAATNSQILTFNGTSWAPSNAPASLGGGSTPVYLSYLTNSFLVVSNFVGGGGMTNSGLSITFPAGYYTWLAHFTMTEPGTVGTGFYVKAFFSPSLQKMNATWMWGADGGAPQQFHRETDSQSSAYLGYSDLSMIVSPANEDVEITGSISNSASTTMNIQFAHYGASTNAFSVDAGSFIRVF